MAGEQGAHHHTFTPSADDAQGDAVPDIFSIIAQESLLDTSQPAFKHLIKVLASKYPAHIGWTYRYADEIFLAIDTFIQYNSLRKLGGSFSEYFYGLKRVTTDGRPWTTKLRSLNLLLLVVVPYLRRKLQTLHEDKSGEVADGLHQGQDLKSKLLRVVLSIYPYAHMAWSGIAFSYFIKFLLHHSDVHSLLLRLCGVKLVPLSLSDMMEESSLPWSDVLTQRTLRGKLMFLLSKFRSSLPHYIFQTFSMLIFFLQFLQWYSNYAQTEGETQAITTASTIPAPKVAEGSSSVISKLNCPLCRKIRTNSTLLSTSGYVYCYPCIYRHVQQNHSCPITGFPSTNEHLVRLYVSDV